MILIKYYLPFLVLHNVMRKFSGTPLFAQVTEKEVMKGWLTKVNLLSVVFFIRYCYCLFYKVHRALILKYVLAYLFLLFDCYELLPSHLCSEEESTAFLKPICFIKELFCISSFVPRSQSIRASRTVFPRLVAAASLSHLENHLAFELCLSYERSTIPNNFFKCVFALQRRSMVRRKNAGQFYVVSTCATSRVKMTW